MKGVVLLFFLVGVVAISGCTIPGTDIEIPGIPDFLGGLGGAKGKADVVVITELKAYPEKVEAGETVKLIALVQNKGKEAFDVVTEKTVFDDVAQAVPAAENKKMTVMLYDSCSGLLEVLDDKGAKKTDALEVPRTTSTTIQPQEIAQFEWNLKAGGPPVQTKCDLRVMVKYGFVTQSATSITFIDRDEYARQLQDNSFRTTSSTTTIGDGPIRTYLTVEDRQPVPANTNAKIELQLKEEGSGFAAFVKGTDVAGKTKDVHFKKESVVVKMPGLAIADENKDSCFLSESGDKFVLKNDETLLREKSAPLRCAIKITDTKTVLKELTKLMTVEAKYVYELRKEVKVTVEPKVK